VAVTCPYEFLLGRGKWREGWRAREGENSKMESLGRERRKKGELRGGRRRGEVESGSEEGKEGREGRERRERREGREGRGGGEGREGREWKLYPLYRDPSLERNPPLSVQYQWQG
jgi:hypothetical protein